jgi:hypothetical protein
VVRGTLAGSVRRSHAKIEIMYLIRELVGSEPPCQKGSWWGLQIPSASNLHKNGNELCFVNTRMLTLDSIQAGQSPMARWGARGWIPPALLISLMQIAHKFDACVLFGMPSVCMRYMVHGMRYEVRGMRYVVHGTEYVVRGTRYEVQNTLYDY